MEDCRSVRVVARRVRSRRVPARLRGRRRRLDWRVGLCGRRARLGRVPASSAASGTVCQRASARSRCAERFGQAEHGLRLACGFDRRDQRLRAATRCRPVRRELGRRRGSAARELVGQPRMQLLALAGQDRRVDRLRQQRMAEPEAARLRVGDQDAVLHCLAERVAQDVVRQADGCAEQRVPDIASCCRGHAQHALRRVVEAGDAL